MGVVYIIGNLISYRKIWKCHLRLSTSWIAYNTNALCRTKRREMPCEQISTTPWEYRLIVSFTSSLRPASRPDDQPSITVRTYTVDRWRARRFFAPCNFHTTRTELSGGVFCADCCGNGLKHDRLIPMLGGNGEPDTWKREDRSSAQPMQYFDCVISPFLRNPSTKNKKVNELTRDKRICLV